MSQTLPVSSADQCLVADIPNDDSNWLNMGVIALITLVVISGAALRTM